ncbi:hypothetical protein Deba_2990 [Desulfarculus baarsii DSM 2075]|uniref:Single Cache domain-containing protein n=1 Tax=Desulfarculus baarsii (strain ATCC 33931 / DSM 2075 / LMG 7858 / VKM B-1802 / 2st14) TaxID=644282 RepID=E1QKY4_DESB2|nr:cache domain-containing protein [Desulfarculus baarsii]ADK86343.1 hypothetical protein Deba_2990 [Desulfarculus baarsii DSM 2075]
MNWLRVVLWLCLLMAVTAATMMWFDVTAEATPQPSRPVNDKSAYAGERARQIDAMVAKAAAAIEEQGQATFVAMNARQAPWYDAQSGLYVFVRDESGVLVVNGAFPEKIGQNTGLANKRSANSHQRLLDGPQTQLWYHYDWPDPQTGKIRWKSALLRLTRAPDGKRYVVGVGDFDLPMERRFVEELVEEAARLVAQKGRAAFELLADPEGPFRFGDIYVFIDEPSGVEIFNPAFPDIQGKNCVELKDGFGNYFVRAYIDKAMRQGGGWTRYNWPRPGQVKPSLKYAYTRQSTMDGKPVIVGMGIYLDQPLDQKKRAVQGRAEQLASLAARLGKYQQARISEMLRGYLIENPGVHGVAWISAPQADGAQPLVDIQLARVKGYGLTQESRVDFPFERLTWLREAARSGKPAWTQARYDQFDPQGDAQIISYVTPVLDAKGQVKAFIASDLLVRPDAPVRQAQLDQLAGAIQGKIDEVIDQLRQTAAAICPVGLGGPTAQALLDQLYQSRPYFFSTLTVDEDGVLRRVAPEAFAAAVGKMTGDPVSTRAVITSGKPVLTKPFATAEGFVACALGCPLPCKANGRDGQVSVTLNPTDLAAEAIPAQLARNCFILRADDGFFVYSDRREDIHRSVLSDPKFQRLYPELAKLGQDIVSQPQGRGSYAASDDDGNAVRRDCLWRTVNFANQRWRVVLFWAD